MTEFCSWIRSQPMKRRQELLSIWVEVLLQQKTLKKD